MKHVKKCSFLFLLVLAWTLLRYASEVAKGVATGLNNCAMLLIPSLFPFMILAAFVSATEVGEELSHWISAILFPITKLPRAIGASFFMSFLGGFPVGAQMLSRQLEHGEIDKKTTERALCCCVNAGPSFLIGTVGLMFHPKAGVYLLIAQICSSLCIAAILFRIFPVLNTSKPNSMQKDSLVESIRSAANGMFSICAFVTAFSACTALLKASGALKVLTYFLHFLFPNQSIPFLSATVIGLLEVTNGCIAAAAVPGGLSLTAFLVSFSSLSIIFQVKSCFHTTISFRPFYFSRIIHGFLTSIFFSLLQHFFPTVAATASFSGTPIYTAQPSTLISAMCLIAMCTILIFSSTKVCNKR